MREIVFEVKPAEEGGYCASAFAQSIFTQGEDWDDLLANIREVLALYEATTGEHPDEISLKVGSLMPRAA